MNGKGTQGRRAVAFLGKSEAVYREGEETDETLVKPATLEEALQDAAVQALADGYENVRVVCIEFKAGNPHIKEVSVTGTPAG
jgi:hypothetical protein